jgi:diguanylate cyclase (GGDEF)-like protein/putative nucleotidyltransferase with HDIG domain
MAEFVTDGLTGLKTHRFFGEALHGEWRRSARCGRPFAVILLDLDGFKQVNDRMGRPEGDKVLTAVAALLDAGSKQSNVVARYGADEFAILMPETSMEQAEILAERLRSTLEADHFLNAHHVTASIGVACFPTHGPTPEEILSVADSGMHLAKQCDGNCVKVATLSIAAGDSERHQQLLEAYLGVAAKRMFSSDNEAFNLYRQKFEYIKPLWDTFTALGFAIEAKDPYTRDHSAEVSTWAAQIALQIGLPQSEVENIKLAGVVHDVGKIHVPGEVLEKPALLTADQFELMKTHAAWGAKILEPLKVPEIERMVRHHHERYDGTGYPDALKGEEIPIGARIIAVAEAFQVMVRGARYQKPRSVEDAVAELRRYRGTQFDRVAVDALVQLIESRGLLQTSGPAERSAI